MKLQDSHELIPGGLAVTNPGFPALKPKMSTLNPERETPIYSFDKYVNKIDNMDANSVKRVYRSDG
jgi:hypothetical protein